MKTVSVIVPVYNRAASIKECYESLINQTYEELELIFVDDGSSDNTFEVMKAFEDKRVMVLSQENAGPSEARRYGFTSSHGEYICFVDSDDTISPDFISRLVNMLEKHDTPVCVGRIGLHVNYDAVKNIIFKAKAKPELINLRDMPEYLPALPQGVVSKLFKREALELKKVEFRANEDLVIMYPMYAKMNYIAVDNEAIYHNYYSRNSQRNLLFGYKFENIYNTFGTLKLVYEAFDEMGVIDTYHDALEMLFIRNIFERITNLADCVTDKVYLDRFIDVLLNYLEYYFPNWENNKYYVRGFRLGEVTDILRVKRAKRIVNHLKRKKTEMSLDEIYDKYKILEKVYEKNK